MKIKRYHEDQLKVKLSEAQKSKMPLMKDILAAAALSLGWINFRVYEEGSFLVAQEITEGQASAMRRLAEVLLEEESRLNRLGREVWRSDLMAISLKINWELRYCDPSIQEFARIYQGCFEIHDERPTWDARVVGRFNKESYRPLGPSEGIFINWTEVDDNVVVQIEPADGEVRWRIDVSHLPMEVQAHLLEEYVEKRISAAELAHWVRDYKE